MAITGQENINIGLPNESANSDSLYTAFTKSQNNFNTLFSIASPYSVFNAGSGISASSNSTTGTVTITNTGVTSIVAGSNVTINSSNGAVTISAGGGGGGGVSNVYIVGASGNARIIPSGTNPITTTGTMVLDLTTTGVVAGTYTYPTLTVDSFGRINNISNGTSLGTVTSVAVAGGPGITVTGSPVTSNGEITVINSGVTRLTAGAGISLTDSTGNITISTSQNIGTVTSVNVTSSTLNVSGSPIVNFGSITIDLPGNTVIPGNIYLPEGSYAPSNGMIFTPNGHATIYSYGSGSHGGPELDYSDTDDIGNFNDSSVYRNTLYLNDTGLYVGLNENGAVGHDTGYLQFNASGNLVTSGSVYAKNINFPDDSFGFTTDTAQILTANGFATMYSYGSGSHGGPELDYSNTDNLANFLDPTTYRNTLYLNGGGLYVGINENNTIGFAKGNLQFDYTGNLTTTGNIYANKAIITDNNFISTGLIVLSGSEDLADMAAANVDITASYFSTGGAETATLAAGTEGQIKTFMMVADLGDMVITVTNAGWGGAGTMTFNDQGDGCILQYINSKWYCIGNNGVIFG